MLMVEVMMRAKFFSKHVEARRSKNELLDGIQEFFMYLRPSNVAYVASDL